MIKNMAMNISMLSTNNIMIFVHFAVSFQQVPGVQVQYMVKILYLSSQLKPYLYNWKVHLVGVNHLMRIWHIFITNFLQFKHDISRSVCYSLLRILTSKCRGFYLRLKWLFTGFDYWVTRWVPLVEQELLTLPKHLNSPWFV